MQIDYRTELETMRKKFKKHRVKPLKVKKYAWVEQSPLNKV